MSIVVVDNFLEEHSFAKLQDAVLGSWFPWYFNNGVSNIDETNSQSYDFQFTHTFFTANKVTSDWFHLLDKILEKIKPITLLRVKANLLTISEKQEIFDYHVDIADIANGKTAIFYINTNNGFTVFEDGTKISSVANRLLIFDANVLHTGTTCSDQKTRCVINFNYIGSL
jgi:hypothetical protein